MVTSCHGIIVCSDRHDRGRHREQQAPDGSQHGARREQRRWRYEVARHADHEIGEIGVAAECAGSGIHERRERDGGANHSLQTPLPGKCLTSCGIVGAQGADRLVRPPSFQRSDRIHTKWPRQLPAAECSVNSFASKRIKKIGGVSDQECARRPGLTRMRCKRANSTHWRHTLGADETARQRRTRAEPLAQKPLGIARHAARDALRDNHRDVRHAVTNRRESDVAVLEDMHLAKRPHASYVAKMRDQRNSTRPS